MPGRKRVGEPRPLVLKGSYLTDGKGLWKVERFDDDFVYVSQPGTVVIPLSYVTVGRLKTANPPKSEQW